MVKRHRTVSIGWLTVGPRAMALSLLVAFSGVAGAETTRGEQLYELHCVACHSEQIHWRERGIVRSWQALLAQVRHWQAYRVLRWSDEDIKEVARYLNDSIYHLPQTSDELTYQLRPTKVVKP